MKTYNSNKQESKQQIKKYIVEAPEPLQGQIASSGGIREKGKLAHQFRNPQPYIEPPIYVKNSSPTNNLKFILEKNACDFASQCSKDILNILWYEYGKPFLIQKTKKLYQKTIDSNSSNNKSIIHTTNTSTIIQDSNAENCVPTYNNKNIIAFPQKNIS